MNYTITAINKETRDQHWNSTLCPFCRKHFILESVYDCAPFDIPHICTRTGINHYDDFDYIDSSCTPFFPSNYNPNDPEFTGEYEGPAYDFNSDDIPF